MIREARSKAVESSIAFDFLMNDIIGEYFIRDPEKRAFFTEEVLPLLPTSQRIGLLAVLPLGDTMLPLSKRYPRLIRRLNLLNSYRNLLVHGAPSTWDKAQIWIHRGKMKPIPVNMRLIGKLEKLAESTFLSLAHLFDRMLKANRRPAQSGTAEEVTELTPSSHIRPVLPA